MSKPLYAITVDGQGRFGSIYTDQGASVMRALGPSQTHRVSDVEPDGEGWSAWIRPVLGLEPVKLGPFPTRAEALAAEVCYLEAKL